MPPARSPPAIAMPQSSCRGRNPAVVKTLPPLPRLAFGNADARVSRDLEAFAAAQRAVMPAIRRYEPCGRRRTFRHRAATLRIGDMKLVASASSPVSVAAEESGDSTLLFLLHGWSTSLIDGREHRWVAGESAMFLPGPRREGRSGVRSLLGITFDPDRLEATARAMLGRRGRRRLAIDLRTPRPIPIHASRSPAGAMLQKILPLVDLAECDESTLRLLGLDDMLYRLIAVLLSPEVLEEAFRPQRESRPAAVVRRVTDHILAHLPGPVVQTDLERVSGLSARSLQMAFHRVHGCSPRDWIRERRLLLARKRLENAAAADTVTAIALESGFTRPGSFSAAYAARFGEPPSKTLARHRG